MSRWKIKRDLGKEERKLAQETKKAGEFASSEKKWSKNMGMIAALAAPMIVATTVFTGGAAMPLWAGMLAAGAGAAAGAKLGEEVAEAKEKGGFQLGEDKYAKGGGLTKGKFLKSEREGVKHSMIENAKNLDTGMLKDAAVASVMYGVKVGGKDMMKSIKGGIKGTLTGDEALKAASKTAFKDKLMGTPEQIAKNKEIFAAKAVEKAEKTTALAEKLANAPEVDTLSINKGGAKAKILGKNKVKNMLETGSEERLSRQSNIKEWWNKVKPKATWKGEVIKDESLADAAGGEILSDAGDGAIETIDFGAEVTAQAGGSDGVVTAIADQNIDKSLTETIMDKTAGATEEVTTASSDTSPLRSAMNDENLFSSVNKVKKTNMASAFGGSAQDYVNANVDFDMEDKLYDMFVGGNNSKELMTKGMWDMVGKVFEPKEEETQGVV